LTDGKNAYDLEVARYKLERQSSKVTMAIGLYTVSQKTCHSYFLNKLTHWNWNIGRFWQQMYSKYTWIAGRLLEVCWMFAGSCKHPIKQRRCPPIIFKLISLYLCDIFAGITCRLDLTLGLVCNLYIWYFMCNASCPVRQN